jgi:hypothetical protein
LAISALSARSKGEQAFGKRERGKSLMMWISLFSFAAAAAVALSVAAIMMQPTGQRTLRG